jgi:hypothetical protein
MLTMDPYILLSQKEILERRVHDLEVNLALARQHACHWEHEAKAARAQVQRLRMECDTERIEREPQPQSLP